MRCTADWRSFAQRSSDVLGDREQFAAQVHQCALVHGAVLAYRTLQLVDHQRWLPAAVTSGAAAAYSAGKATHPRLGKALGVDDLDKMIEKMRKR